MELSEEARELLGRQGLAADIRNKLGNAKSVASLLKSWEKETDPSKKAALLDLLVGMAEKLDKSTDHICKALELYGDPKNKIPF